MNRVLRTGGEFAHDSADLAARTYRGEEIAIGTATDPYQALEGRYRLMRGVLAALSGWTKFASLLVAPLWLTYPGRRPSRGFALGFAAATLAAFSILLLAPDPFHEAHVFWSRTVGFQIGRAAPWSLWDWRQYHARGLPDLHLVQYALQGLLLAGAVAVAFLLPETWSPEKRAEDDDDDEGLTALGAVFRDGRLAALLVPIALLLVAMAAVAPVAFRRSRDLRRHRGRMSAQIADTILATPAIRSAARSSRLIRRAKTDAAPKPSSIEAPSATMPASISRRWTRWTFASVSWSDAVSSITLPSARTGTAASA